MVSQQTSTQPLFGALVDRLKLKLSLRRMVRGEIKDMIRRGELDRDLRRLGYHRHEMDRRYGRQPV